MNTLQKAMALQCLHVPYFPASLPQVGARDAGTLGAGEEPASQGALATHPKSHTWENWDFHLVFLPPDPVFCS